MAIVVTVREAVEVVLGEKENSKFCLTLRWKFTETPAGILKT